MSWNQSNVYFKEKRCVCVSLCVCRSLTGTHWSRWQVCSVSSGGVWDSEGHECQGNTRDDVIMCASIVSSLHKKKRMFFYGRACVFMIWTALKRHLEKNKTASSESWQPKKTSEGKTPSRNVDGSVVCLQDQLGLLCFLNAPRITNLHFNVFYSMIYVHIQFICIVCSLHLIGLGSPGCAAVIQSYFEHQLLLRSKRSASRPSEPTVQAPLGKWQWNCCCDQLDVEVETPGPSSRL